jgi:peptide/nickel transport system ATP-binding protein
MERLTRLQTIEGTVPSPTNLPDGCHFAPRCEFRMEGVCTTGEIPLYEISGEIKARCVLYDEELKNGQRQKSISAVSL